MEKSEKHGDSLTLLLPSVFKVPSSRLIWPSHKRKRPIFTLVREKNVQNKANDLYVNDNKVGA